jgi:hypothetical protein
VGMRFCVLVAVAIVVSLEVVSVQMISTETRLP